MKIARFKSKRVLFIREMYSTIFIDTDAVCLYCIFGSIEATATLVYIMLMGLFCLTKVTFSYDYSNSKEN